MQHVLYNGSNDCYYWLVLKATNLWFHRVSQAGVLARVQGFSGVFSLVICIICHMTTAEDSRGVDERYHIPNEDPWLPEI